MRILVTGCLGYIGSELGKIIKESIDNTFLVGMDVGLFSTCHTTQKRPPDSFYDAIYYKDVRDIVSDDLIGFDAVIALAAVSNDPIGRDFESATYSINQDANINLAKLCVENDVRRFVFASSCSVYGAGGTKARDEISKLDPLTAYAKSKVNTEFLLDEVSQGTDLEIVSLRFSTACGQSSRLRLDLVLNDFVATALLCKKIVVLSDGSPWRPLIDVKDMCNAICWSLKSEMPKGLVSRFNIGSNNWNFQVKELANICQKALGGVDVCINSEAPADSRSYKVNFDKYNNMASNFTDFKDIEDTIYLLSEQIRSLESDNLSVLKGKLVRLNHLKQLILADELTNDLRWK